MNVKPCIGMAFITEDKRDFSTDSINIPDHVKKGVGTTGIIMSVKNLLEIDASLYYDALNHRCPWIKDITPDQQDQLYQFCQAMERGHEAVEQYKAGDHVVFSKFNEQIVVYENGKEVIYYSVPVQSILGFVDA